MKKNKPKIMKTALLITASLILIKSHAIPGDNYNNGPFRCTHNGTLYAMTMMNCPQYTEAHHRHYGVPTNATGVVLKAYDENGIVIKIYDYDHTDLDCILKKIPDGH